MRKITVLLAAVLLTAWTVTVPAVAGPPERDQADMADKAIDLSVANLPTGETGLVLGLGLGTFRDAEALAAGASYGVGPLGLTLGIAVTSDREVAAGVGFNWRLR